MKKISRSLVKLVITVFTLNMISISAFAAQKNINVTLAKDSSGLSIQTVDRYSYNFGRVPVGSPVYATYRLTNTGTLPLTFASASISGLDYSARHDCVDVLLPQERCTFEIRFYPLLSGYQSGRFVLSFQEDLDIVVDLWAEAYRPY